MSRVVSGPGFGLVIGAQTKAGQTGGATQWQIFDGNDRAVPVSKLLGGEILMGKGKPIGLPK